MEVKSALLFKDMMCSDVALACWHEGMQQLAGTLNKRSILSSLFLSGLNFLLPVGVYFIKFSHYIDVVTNIYIDFSLEIIYFHIYIRLLFASDS